MKILSWLWAFVVLLLNACSSTPVPPSGVGAEGQALRDHSERLIVVAVANPREALIIQAGSTGPGYTAVQRYAAGSSARETLAAVKKDYKLRELAAWPIAALRLHCVVLELASGVPRDALLATLAKDTRIEIAQPLQSFTTLTGNGLHYNDPYIELQHGFSEINAAGAHQVARGRGVRVALIDTGVDTAHPDLLGQIATTRNFVDRDNAQFNRDRHGTEVAGIIVAVANNNEGIVGIAPEAKLSVYKACWQPTADAGARCNSFTLAQALTASLDEGSRIINLSLGGPSDELLGRLVSYALKQGRIVIGAMPEDGKASGFPTGIEGVIAVDIAVRRPAQHSVAYAPGRDILTLEPGGHYDFSSGSSLAAAHVSAVVALMLSVDPTLTGAAVRAILQSSQTSTTNAGAMIDACAALAAPRNVAACNSRRQPSQGAHVDGSISTL